MAMEGVSDKKWMNGAKGIFSFVIAFFLHYNDYPMSSSQPYTYALINFSK